MPLCIRHFQATRVIIDVRRIWQRWVLHPCPWAGPLFWQ